MSYYIFLKRLTQFLEGDTFAKFMDTQGEVQTSSGAGPTAVLLWIESLSALSSAVDLSSTEHSEYAQALTWTYLMG